VGHLPLDPFPVIRTRNADEMQDALIRIYGGRRFDLTNGADDFEAHANHCQLQSVGLSYCGYKSPVELDFPEAGFVRQQICLSGSGQSRLGSRTIEVSDRQSCIISPGAAVTADFGRRYAQIVVQIEAAALHEKLASQGVQAQPQLLADGVP
jgi:hypothetical protein